MNLYFCSNGSPCLYRCIGGRDLRIEEHLRQQGRQWNTISTNLRILHALYNRGVDRNWVPVAPRLFEHVYTGTRVESKRALSAQEMTRYCVRQKRA